MRPPPRCYLYANARGKAVQTAAPAARVVRGGQGGRPPSMSTHVPTKALGLREAVLQRLQTACTAGGAALGRFQGPGLSSLLGSLCKEHTPNHQASPLGTAHMGHMDHLGIGPHRPHAIEASWAHSNNSGTSGSTWGTWRWTFPPGARGIVGLRGHKEPPPWETRPDARRFWVPVASLQE